jgi:hypothetical protein
MESCRAGQAEKNSTDPEEGGDVMKTLFTMIFGLSLIVGMFPSLSQGASSTVERFIGGTIEGIDSAGLQLTIQTDQGQKESLKVANAEVMKRVTKGDRVSVELDEQGRVMKIVKIPSDPVSAPEPKS